MWSTYLKVLREASGETQEDLARAIGRTQGTVSKWETRIHPPDTPSEAVQVAQHYDRNPLEAFVICGWITVAQAGHALDKEGEAMIRRVKRLEAQRRLKDGT